MDNKNPRPRRLSPDAVWSRRRISLFAIDLAVLGGGGALVVAYLLRFEFAIPAVHWRGLLLQFPLVIAAQVSALFLVGIQRFTWRYISLQEVSAFARAACYATLPLLVLRIALPEALNVL